MVESIKEFKFNHSSQEDIYKVIIQKTKEFLENVHSKSVADRLFFKESDGGYSHLEAKLKEDDSSAFKKIFYYKCLLNLF
mgnify:CR=1 FL=1